MADVHAPRMQQEMELAAFEKGRLQGEMEASRRMELERSKQLLPAAAAVPVATAVITPDIVEINRLTWLQRGAALLGELCTIAQVVLTIVWIKEYRGDFSWVNGNDGGNVNYWNTHFLTNCLGLFFLANAITNYRMLPIRWPAMLNRAWYIFMQSAAIVCFTLALVSIIRATPEDRLWNVWQWVYVMAYCVTVLHSLYSIIVHCLEPLHHRAIAKSAGGNYGTHSRTGTHLETPEQRRDHSQYNHDAATIYAPAPGLIHRAAAAATGAPAAPIAPRWSENPKTNSSHYFLLHRAKWAVVGFWAIGAAILMDLAASQQLIASGNSYWSSQVGQTGEGIDRTGREMAIIGATGILTLAMLGMMSYVAMPPRTAIVKNGVAHGALLADRRTSISHNAETRLGPNIV